MHPLEAALRFQSGSAVPELDHFLFVQRVWGKLNYPIYRVCIQVDDRGCNDAVRRVRFAIILARRDQAGAEGAAMNDGNLELGVRLFITVVILGFALLVAFCFRPEETYDRDLIGGR